MKKEFTMVGGGVRSSAIDGLKGLAIIGVLFAHADFSGRFSVSALKFVDDGQTLLGWCVIAFFFASGYLGAAKRDESFWSYIAERSKRLLLPCMIFSVTYKVLLLILGLVGALDKAYGFPDALFELVRFIVLPVGPQFYFLLYLFVICVSVEVLRRLIATEVIFLLGLVLVSLFQLWNPASQPYGPDYALVGPYCLAYIAGLSFNSWAKNSLTQLLVVVAIALLSITLRLDIFVYLAVCISLFILANQVQPAAFFVFLGRRSSGIFVWHAPIMLPMCSLVAVAVVGTGVVSLLVALCTCITLCIAVERVVYKYSLLRWWRF